MFISHCWTHVPTVSNTPIVTNVNGNTNKAIMPDKHGKSDNIIHWHTDISNVPNSTIKKNIPIVQNAPNVPKCQKCNKWSKYNKPKVTIETKIQN